MGNIAPLVLLKLFMNGDEIRHNTNAPFCACAIIYF